METAKEKAIEMISRIVLHCDGMNMFESYEYNIAKENAKLCALIMVDMVLKDLIESAKVTEESEFHPHARGLIMGSMVIWNGVKDELLKL